MNFNEYISQGFVFFQEGKTELALENLEAALKLQPNNPELQQMIAGLKTQAVHTSNISQLFLDEAKSRAKTMNDLYGVKLEDITIAGVDNMITVYRSNQNHPSLNGILASAYYIRGLLSDSKGEYAQAAEDYSEAIKNEPNFPLAFKNRGQANLETGNYDQAIEDFKKANIDDAKLKQNLARVYMKRGIAYDKKNDYANAAKDYAEALKLEPDNSNARELLDMAKNQM